MYPERMGVIYNIQDRVGDTFVVSSAKKDLWLNSASGTDVTCVWLSIFHLTLPFPPVPIVFIEEEAYSGSEEEGSLSLVIIRQGNLSASTTVLVSTVEDSAVGEREVYAVGIRTCTSFQRTNLVSLLIHGNPYSIYLVS